MPQIMETPVLQFSSGLCHLADEMGFTFWKRQTRITGHGLSVMWFRNGRGPSRWGIPTAQNDHRSLDQ